jgi:hypothetical protein
MLEYDMVGARNDNCKWKGSQWDSERCSVREAEEKSGMDLLREVLFVNLNLIWS